SRNSCARSGKGEPSEVPLGRGTLPGDDQAPTVQQQTEFAPDHPAVVGKALAAELMLMRVPRPRATNPGIAARASRHGGSTLSWIMLSRRSGSALAKSPLMAMPALLTSTVMLASVRRVAYPMPADNVSRLPPSRLSRVKQPVISTQNRLLSP